jgi:hypothetical protein
LTHLSGDHDQAWVQREAERTFDGPVEIACEGAVYQV